MTDDRLDLSESSLCSRLEPRGRILEDPDHYVWGCAPIYGPDGRVHVFYSRWRPKHEMIGWQIDCEIAHAVADDPEGPYTPVEDPVVLSGAGGDAWDGVTVHNPTVHAVGDRYVLFYMANQLTYDLTLVEATKIGMAVADSLDGPWERSPENPIIERGESGAWDDVGLDNPAFLAHPDGRFLLYYRGWTSRDDHRNDVVGVAIAEDVEGPYEKYDDNPVVDPRTLTDRRPVGVEDPCAYLDGEAVRLLTRDFGVVSGRDGFSPCSGLLFRSEDGLDFEMPPEIAYHPAEHYYDDIAGDRDLIRYGRFERPKVLLNDDGRPTHLFNAIRGGAHGYATGHVFEIRPE